MTKPATLDAAELIKPTIFTEAILGVPLYDWQRRALVAAARDIGRNRTAVCAPNGSGKSKNIIASLVCWWLTAHPKGKVVVTTADGKQLDGQIIPAIWSHRERFPTWRFVEREITNGTGGFARFWTTDEPGRAEGWHGEQMVKWLDGVAKLNPNADPLLIIVDEAKSVPEPIFMALDRCTFQSILYISSPGLMEGRFFRAMKGKDQDRYATVQAGLADCPHIAPEKIQDIIREYGEQHPFTRSTLHGEFMDNSADNHIFSLYDIQAAWASPPAWQNGRRVAYCDFAGGCDENVLALREGNRITIEKAWREPNEMVAIGKFLQLFTRLGLKPQETYGDVSGAGKVMISRFDEVGWTMGRVNNGLAASRRDFYKNAGTEMWADTSLAVKRQEIIIPNDELLCGQLTTRLIKFDSKGRMWMESKEELKLRGLPSPDRADAICGAFWCGGLGRALLLQGGKLMPLQMDGDYELDNPGGSSDSELMRSFGAFAGV